MSVNESQATPTQPTEESPKQQMVFNRKLIKKGILYFILFTLLSLAILFFYSNTGKAIEVLGRLDFRFLALAVGMSLLDMWLGGWRNHILARVLKPGISQMVCIRANLANIFMGAVTPSQTGGAPAQLYIWHREGIPLKDGLTISLINWFSTLIFFPTSAFIALMILKNQFSEDILSYLLRFGFIIFLVLLTLVTIAFIRPILIGKVLRGIGYWIGSLNSKWEQKIVEKADQLYASVQGYQQSCKALLIDRPYLFPYSFFMTTLLYFNKFCLAYVLMLGIGGTAAFWPVIAVQVVVIFILYFAPSPGGSGIAELSIAGLMSSILASDLVPAFTLLHRVFLLFIPAIVGTWVVTSALRKHAEE